jgi:hypothetical protein
MTKWGQINKVWLVISGAIIFLAAVTTVCDSKTREHLWNHFFPAEHPKETSKLVSNPSQEFTRAEQIPNSAQALFHSQDDLSVEIWLPSEYNDSDILVDGAAAKIINRTPSFTSVLVTRQNVPHVFEIIKGSVVRKETLLILTNNTLIKPFAY